MASINFDDYEKNQQDQSPGDEVVTKKISIGRLETSDIQYYVAEENVLFDFIELNPPISTPSMPVRTCPTGMGACTPVLLRWW